MTSSSLDETPQSIVRLASVIYRFKVPSITKRVSFLKAFKTVGSASQTRTLMLNADDTRESLCVACEALNVSSDRVISDAKNYYPLIHTVLVSCKVQPDQARLDEKLVFEWKSGMEAKPIPYKSEVMMYDFIMTLASLGLAHSVSATEHSIAGDFAASSRDYAAAAGVFCLVADELLPKWTSKGDKVDDDVLPIECHPVMVKAMSSLFMANGQQMAVATLLIKDGKPNYSLLSKLCLGVAEQLEQAISWMKGKALNQLNRMDADFVTLTTLQISIQKSLSLYYQSRASWDRDEFGIAIAMLSEANVSLQSQKNMKGDGIPDLSKIPTLKHLSDDVKDLRAHMAALLQSWERDNSTIYFTSVPKIVPADKKLKEGLQMKKKTDIVIEEVQPVLLSVPKYSILNVGGLFSKKT